MSPDKITATLLALQPGESVIYFVGFLDMDRMTDMDLIRVAMLAQRLFQQGKVHLTQRRLGLPMKDGQIDWCAGVGPGFEYIATGKRREEKWINLGFSNSGLGSLTK